MWRRKSKAEGGRRKGSIHNPQPKMHDAPANARDALAALIESNNPHLFDLYQICVYRRFETGDGIKVTR